MTVAVTPALPPSLVTLSGPRKWSIKLPGDEGMTVYKYPRISVSRECLSAVGRLNGLSFSLFPLTSRYPQEQSLSVLHFGHLSQSRKGCPAS